MFLFVSDEVVVYILLLVRLLKSEVIILNDNELIVGLLIVVKFVFFCLYWVNGCINFDLGEGVCVVIIGCFRLRLIFGLM